jgi:hypothetical protein
MTSTTNARECEEAVDEMLSTDSHMRCKAVDAPAGQTSLFNQHRPCCYHMASNEPMVMSVVAMSLSILPTSFDTQGQADA